jgi:hypothetical protein
VKVGTMSKKLMLALICGMYELVQTFHRLDID